MSGTIIFFQNRIDCLENIVGKPPSLKHEVWIFISYWLNHSLRTIQIGGLADKFPGAGQIQVACWTTVEDSAHVCLVLDWSRMNCAPNPISKSPGSSPNYQNLSKSCPKGSLPLIHQFLTPSRPSLHSAARSHDEINEIRPKHSNPHKDEGKNSIQSYHSRSLISTHTANETGSTTTTTRHVPWITWNLRFKGKKWECNH